MLTVIATLKRSGSWMAIVEDSLLAAGGPAFELTLAAGEFALLPLGASDAFHADLLLTPLRGYPPFDALLQPDD